jgi:hypothetical protein
MQYLQANPNRRIPPNWVVNHKDVGQSRGRWAQWLCLEEDGDDEAILRGLEALTRSILKETKLHLLRLTAPEAQRKVDRLVGERVARERPDLCCASVSRDAFIRLVRTIVVRINSEDSAKKGSERRRTSHSVDAISEHKPSQSTDASDDSKLGGLSDNAVTNQREISSDSTSAPTGSYGKRQLDSKGLAVMIEDPLKPRRIHISHLHDLAQESDTIDLPSCRCIKLERLYDKLAENEEYSGLSFFNRKEDILRCKIGETEYDVTDPDVFQFLCHLQLCEVLDQDLMRPLVIKFERRPKESHQPLRPSDSPPFHVSPSDTWRNSEGTEPTDRSTRQIAASGAGRNSDGTRYEMEQRHRVPPYGGAYLGNKEHRTKCGDYDTSICGLVPLDSPTDSRHLGRIPERELEENSPDAFTSNGELSLSLRAC